MVLLICPKICKLKTEKAEKWKSVLAQSCSFATIQPWITGIPFLGDQFFHIHGNKLKLHPVCYLCEAFVLRVTHTVLLFRIGCTRSIFSFLSRYNTLYTAICHTCTAIYIILPDMAYDRFLVLGIFGTHPSGGTVLQR